MSTRRGYTLIELLIAIAILAILVGVTLVAVQKVRERAVRLRSENNLRQIVLGVHNYAATKQMRLPGTDVGDPTRHSEVERGILLDLAGYIEGEAPTPPVASVLRPDGTVDDDRFSPRRRTYISPGDPTVPLWDIPPPGLVFDGQGSNTLFRRSEPPTSYALNMVAFTGSPTLSASFSDGTSNTIALAERYAIGNRFEYPPVRTCYFSYVFAGPTGPLFGPQPDPPDLGGPRRPTFADAGWRDVVPVTTNGVTRASVPGKTFQVRPRPEQADASVVQTPFAAGLPVAMFDGSVRTISPRVSETAFWAAVTPAGGETATLD